MPASFEIEVPQLSDADARRAHATEIRFRLANDSEWLSQWEFVSVLVWFGLG
jgi:hypothetical protein